MRLSSRLKLVVAVILVITIGVGINAITSPSSGPSLESLLGAEFRNDVAYKLVATQTATVATQLSQPSFQTRMVIFTATISIETKDVRSSLTQATSIAEQMGGYVAGSSFSIFGDTETASITMRVPRDKFHQAIAAIESLGELKDKQTQSDDVTEEYIDLSARRDNLEKQENRLQEILTLARTVDDVLKVEAELGRVRGEIESLTGRINYLENNVALSTILVTFTTPRETPLPELDWTEPFKTGFAFLYETVRGLVIFAFIAIPFVLIATPAYLVYRRRRNKHAANAESKESPSG